jgi:cellulose synthase/poly-beta-1,6-N-acetylglucosamine synthase-like glycosyltransferase
MPDHGRERRRQWGGDRQQDPMPAVPAAPSDFTMAAGRMALVVTFVAWLAFLATTFGHQFTGPAAERPGLLQSLFYVGLVTALAASAMAYLVARLGFFARARTHRRAARAAIDEEFADGAPSLTMIIPSYQEDARVVRLTLLTAALQEYPDLRVVLLVDDPPHPRYAKPEQLLHAARDLPGEIEALLAQPGAHFTAARDRFAARAATARDATAAEVHRLAAYYEEAETWLARFVAAYTTTDHSERFVADHVLGRLGADLSVTAAALRTAADDRHTRLSTTRLGELYGRLASIFSVQISSFERKRYTSLSHEPNKAMNLNAYIGLMGGRYREVATPSGIALVSANDETEAEGFDIEIPDPDYVLTLDADSILLPEYCLRLVHLLEQDHNQRLAVAQTPYSAYPGAATRMERIAGATTDIQHIVHQGMTHYFATFWVGANAVLRKRALDEICETEYVGGWPVHRYIKDRTVIEDTESSIDLVIHDWQLHNYGERLSYSATPPDFGSLAIQRQRWANGGLLIAPKLLAYMRARRARGERNRFSELFLRANYMMSICWTSISLPLLLVYQFNGRLMSPIVLLMALPYFLAMASDLRTLGYKPLDVLRIYAFNLLLLAVNLSGWASSIAQGLTGAKGQFRRTPKVRSRTVPALLFVVFPYALIGLSLVTLKADYDHQHWANAFFAAANALLGAYAILAFVGLRHSIADVWANISSWLYTPARSTARAQQVRRSAKPAPLGARAEVANWQEVLYFGGTDVAPQMVQPATGPRARPQAPQKRVPLTHFRRATDTPVETVAADALGIAQPIDDVVRAAR